MNIGSLPAPKAAAGEALEFIFRPDPSVYDGRYANNGWLQELPKPVTKLTWDNAAMVSPKTVGSTGPDAQGCGARRRARADYFAADRYRTFEQQSDCGLMDAARSGRWRRRSAARLWATVRRLLRHEQGL